MSELDNNQNKEKIACEKAYARASQILKAISPEKEQLGLISKETASIIDFLKKTIALGRNKQSVSGIEGERQDLANGDLKSNIVVKIHGKKQECVKLKPKS